MNDKLDFDKFRLPKESFEDFKNKYVLEVGENKSDPGVFPMKTISVYKVNKETNNKEKVFEYERTYSLMNTFYPFRKYNKETNVWGEYALFSDNYTTFKVVDLLSGTVVAKEAPFYREMSKEKGDDLSDFYRKDEVAVKLFKDKGVIDASGFCPTEFKVFDIAEEIPYQNDGILTESYDKEDAVNLLGDFALMAGCYWGDDFCWKIRYLDLSDFLDTGLVQAEEKFGYLEMNPKSTLEESSFQSESNRLYLPALKYFEL